MNKVKLGNLDLDYRFKYKYRPNKRLAIEKTIDSVVVQSSPFVLQDTLIEWEYPYASSSLRNYILSLYQSGAVTTFIDYDNQSYNIMLTAFEEEEKNSMYNLKGTFIIIST
ncbi:MAG TPA: hypothetical protein PLK41_04620 [Defluviitoga tunisiensis]|nr:hypothetical protein [bacterium]HPP10255.1 hypothetical protein [Defluviitoga tunisiensis]